MVTEKVQLRPDHCPVRALTRARCDVLTPKERLVSAGTSDMLANGQPAAGVTGIQAMPAVLQMIRNNLETQKRLSRIVLAEMKDKVRSLTYDICSRYAHAGGDKLAHEIQTYLTALRNTQAVASPVRSSPVRTICIHSLD